jgi:hypothetical protein
MKQLFAVVMFFPLFAFLIAGLMELRSDSSLAQRVGKLVPVILGLAAFVLSFNPQGFLHATPSSSVTLSRVMTMVCAAIACSGAFMVYSRRISSIFIALGGLVLAFGWMFNRIVV